tara:strand:+ start:69451 stop:69714 length:264 start_codon:yes stop_codon:yes gene_type:complete
MNPIKIINGVVMRAVNPQELNSIAAGCTAELTCQNVTEAMLEICRYPELQLINQLFKNVVLSDAMQGADGETLKAGMIEAIQSADFG